VFNLQFNMQDLNNDVVKNFTRREIVEDLKLVGDQKDKIMKADYIVTEQSFEDMQLLIIMNNGMKLYKRKTL